MAGLSCAITVMERIDGWLREDGECVVAARLAAEYWIHTKAVKVQGATRQLRKEVLMQNMHRLGMQVAELHEWVTEFTLVAHKHKNTGVPGV